MIAFDLIDLELIAYLDEDSSLTSVAVRANMSLSAVSLRLKRLEQRMGTQLWYRFRQGGLTRVGHTFMDSAKVIQREIERLAFNLKQVDHAGSGILKMRANSSILIGDLPSVLSRLSMEHPTMRLELDEGAPQEIMAAVLDGSVDIGLFSRVAPVHGLSFHVYKRERACIVVPLDHPLADRTEVEFVETLKYDFIGTDDKKRIDSMMTAKAREVGASIQFRARVSNFDAQITLVAETNMGIAFVSEDIARRHAQTRAIKIIRLADEWAVRDFVICIRDMQDLTPAGRGFVTMMLA